MLVLATAGCYGMANGGHYREAAMKVARRVTQDQVIDNYKKVFVSPGNLTRVHVNRRNQVCAIGSKSPPTVFLEHIGDEIFLVSSCLFPVTHDFLAGEGGVLSMVETLNQGGAFGVQPSEIDPTKKMRLADMIEVVERIFRDKMPKFEAASTPKDKFAPWFTPSWLEGGLDQL